MEMADTFEQNFEDEEDSGKNEKTWTWTAAVENILVEKRTSSAQPAHQKLIPKR